MFSVGLLLGASANFKSDYTRHVYIKLVSIWTQWRLKRLPWKHSDIWKAVSKNPWDVRIQVLLWEEASTWMLCWGKLHTWATPTCLAVKSIITYTLTITAIITVSFTPSQGHSVSQGESNRCIIDCTGPSWFNDHTGTGETVLKETLVYLFQLH